MDDEQDLRAMHESVSGRVAELESQVRVLSRRLDAESLRQFDARQSIAEIDKELIGAERRREELRARLKVALDHAYERLRRPPSKG